MMNKFLSIYIAVLLPAFHAMAQEPSAPLMTTEGTYRYADAVQLWRTTGNAAAMTVDTLATRGYAEAGAERTAGSYHRVQEGASVNQVSFYAERYQPMGKYLYGYGSFQFRQSRTKERAWSDVMRTYDSTPFFSGSDVPGRYDEQHISLAARIATISFNGWRFGMALDYQVGDMSRLRDPRSRNRLLDYRLTPSVAYTIGRSTLGVSAHYDRRKEKMPTLTTVQNNPNLYYYQMSGLESATGTIGGYTGFQREYVNHSFGAALDYGYKTASYATVNTIGITRAADYIYEQYKREPGRYYTQQYDFTTQHRLFTDRLMHQVDGSVEYEQGYADEYRPQLNITIDPDNGFKSYHYENQMTYKKRYQSEILNLSLRYRLNFLEKQSCGRATATEAVKRFAGISAQLRTVQQKHLLPLSTFDHNTFAVNAEYGQGLIKNSVWVEAEAGYLNSMKADLNLADPSTDYAQSVLLKDMEYYNSNCVRGKLSVKYQFPLKIKNTTSLFYVKGHGEYLSGKGSLNRYSVGLTVGVFN